MNEEQIEGLEVGRGCIWRERKVVFVLEIRRGCEGGKIGDGTSSDGKAAVFVLEEYMCFTGIFSKIKGFRLLSAIFVQVEDDAWKWSRGENVSLDGIGTKTNHAVV